MSVVCPRAFATIGRMVAYVYTGGMIMAPLERVAAAVSAKMVTVGWSSTFDKGVWSYEAPDGPMVLNLRQGAGPDITRFDYAVGCEGPGGADEFQSACDGFLERTAALVPAVFFTGTAGEVPIELSDGPTIDGV